MFFDYLAIWADFTENFSILVNYLSVRIDLAQRTAIECYCFAVLEFSNNVGDILNANNIIVGH